MREVLTRRFRRLIQATTPGGAESAEDLTGSPIDPATGKARKFAYPPNLVVVDGGLPQVNAAVAVLADMGIPDVQVVGLAKRLEDCLLYTSRYGPWPRPPGFRSVCRSG